MGLLFFMGWTILLNLRYYNGLPIYDEEEEPLVNDYIFFVYDTEPEDETYKVFDTKQIFGALIDV